MKESSKINLKVSKCKNIAGQVVLVYNFCCRNTKISLSEIQYEGSKLII